jgi:hypothetical protein
MLIYVDTIFLAVSNSGRRGQLEYFLDRAGGPVFVSSKGSAGVSRLVTSR